MFELKTTKNCNNELRVTLVPIRFRGESLREKALAHLAVPDSEMREFSSVARNADGTLDIRSDFKTKKISCNAHGYKRTKFGRYAQTRLIRSAGAMDSFDPNPAHYLFLTATLPSDEEWAKWAIAEDSHNLINGFKAWLSKRVQSRHEFYVWEHQRREALHFHYCIHVPDREIHAAIARDFRAEWMRLLSGMEERTGVSAWGRHANLSDEKKYEIIQTRAETVYSSVGQYMAGYCSDGRSKHSKDDYIPYYPKRWFGVSRGLSALVREQTESDTEIYSSYRAAKISFDKTVEDFSLNSVTSRIFKHKVGVGETSVNYHTPNDALKIWQSRKAMIYKQQNFPHIWSLIQTALKIQQTISRLEIQSPQFRALSCNLPIESLKAGWSEGSLRRGSLHVSQAEAIESMWLNLSSRSSLHPSLKTLLIELKRFIMKRSQNFSREKWSDCGWLNTLQDFDAPVDILESACYARTSVTDEGTAPGIASELNQIATVLNPGLSQLELF